MQYEKIVKLFRNRINEFKRQGDYADSLGISNSAVTNCLKLEPGLNNTTFEIMLEDLGYERVTDYRKIK